MGRKSRFSPEVKERAVRLVLDHVEEHSSQWQAIQSVAAKIGCAPETLRTWVRRTEVSDARTEPSRERCSHRS
jgi:transposase-like protein